jgi:hypothetical protein
MLRMNMVTILKLFDMKNIHLLPTTKEQHSIIRKNTGLLLVQTPRKEFSGTKLNIYITSNEEIKDGEYGLSRLGEIIKFHSAYDYRYYAKIILTTDQDLIADGVQAIDDTFLEWFVKNPSCEFVELGLEHYFDKNIDKSPFFPLRYKIIIPQEKNTIITDWLDEHGDPEIDKKVEKQLELEEAAEKYQKTVENKTEYGDMADLDFIAGAKWQAERMYSEEDAIQLLIKFNQEIQEVEDVRKWFEQFKKK